MAFVAIPPPLPRAARASDARTRMRGRDRCKRDCSGGGKDDATRRSDRQPTRGVEPRGEAQRRLFRALADAEVPVVVASGPAGTGKTLLAVAAAVAALERGDVDRVLFSRPAVGADEDLGFLPGGIAEKMHPFLVPMLDAAEAVAGPAAARRWLASGAIQPAPLAYVRGRTFRRAYAILDECQSATVEQVKTFLTRLGSQGKVVLTGDPDQHDRKGARNGLIDALERFERRPVDGVEVFRLGRGDIQRHPAIAGILEAYEDGEPGIPPARRWIPPPRTPSWLDD